MSGTTTIKTSDSDKILDRFIKDYPHPAKSARSLAKVALIFSAVAATMAILVCSMVVVNNPNVIYFSQWHASQIVCFAAPATASLLSGIIGCFFSCVHGRMQERVLEAS